VKTHYRLPTGLYTASRDRYAREWRRLGKVVGRVFGGRLCGYDPNLLMYDADGFGSYTVPAWQALRLQELEER